MASIPTVAPHADASVWKVLAAMLHLGNAKFKGSGEATSCSPLLGPSIGVSGAPARLQDRAAHQRHLHAQHQGRASLDRQAPTTSAYARSRQGRALEGALLAPLRLASSRSINESLMFGGDTRFFIGAVDIFGFECFPHNSLEQLCINFANEKLQRMFTEAVFESVLAEYRRRASTWAA